MKEEIIIAGFGGQGVLSMGKILAYSAVMQQGTGRTCGTSNNFDQHSQSHI